MDQQMLLLLYTAIIGSNWLSQVMGRRSDSLEDSIGSLNNTQLEELLAAAKTFQSKPEAHMPDSDLVKSLRVLEDYCFERELYPRRADCHAHCRWYCGYYHYCFWSTCHPSNDQYCAWTCHVNHAAFWGTMTVAIVLFIAFTIGTCCCFAHLKKKYFGNGYMAPPRPQFWFHDNL